MKYVFLISFYDAKMLFLKIQNFGKRDRKSKGFDIHPWCTKINKPDAEFEFLIKMIYQLIIKWLSINWFRLNMFVDDCFYQLMCYFDSNLDLGNRFVYFCAWMNIEPLTVSVPFSKILNFQFKHVGIIKTYKKDIFHYFVGI